MPFYEKKKVKKKTKFLEEQKQKQKKKICWSLWKIIQNFTLYFFSV